MDRPRAGRGRQPRPRGMMMRLVGGVVAGVLVAAGLAILITYLVILPHKPKYYLDYASVSKFNITSDGLLNTNLDFHITTRNPNRKVAIYYDRIQAFLLYGRDQIGWATLPVFYQGHKNTTFLETRVTGQEVALHRDSAKDLKLEKASGTLDLDFKLYARLRFKVGSWKSKRYTMKVKCRHAMINVNGGAFKPMKCKVDL